MRIRTCLLWVFLLIAVRYSYAQSFYFKHYQVEDGLANNTVFSIFQDKKGFIWLGTKEGLNRFDGATFKAFNMAQNSMKEFVYCLDEGINGTLWVGTRKGIFEFNEEKETFALLKPSANAEILDIEADHKGKIWFTADQKLYCYNERDLKTRFYDLEHLGIGAICMASDGSLWASSTDGYIFRYEPVSDTFSCVNKTLRSGQSRPKDVNRMYWSDKEGVFIGTVTGLILFDPHQNTYRELLGKDVQGKPVYVRDILEPSANEFWIATESGVYIYHSKTGETINLRKQNSDPYSISDNAVYALCKDKEGGIWSGTYFGGLNYFHRQQTYFKKYSPNARENRISGNAVRELCEDHEGNLWIGTEDAGLNKLDKSTGKIINFAPGPGKSTVCSNNIHGLLVDGNELWVGTFEQGLDILAVSTGKLLRHYSADAASNGLRSNFIITFCKTRGNEILVGTSRGVYRYNRKEKRFALVPQIPQNSFVFSLFEDGKGTVWAGTIGNGVYYFNVKTSLKGNFRYDPKNANSISSNSVCGIFQDSHQNFWFATEGGGVCKLSEDRKKFTRFDVNSGLPSNMVYKVLEDRKNDLWMSTSKGLACYSPSKGKWKVYTKAHGLLTDQFNYNSAYTDSDGTMYFGSAKGLISFNPGSIVKSRFVPPVYITSFRVNNEELPIDGSPLKRSVTFTDTIALRYNQSSFSISFSALTYIAPEMTQYAYKLEGLDKDWTYLKTNRSVYFTGLAPGNYTFRVKTADGDGTWNKKETTLVIQISPPFWLSRYAYLTYVIVALYLIYAGISRYHNKLKEKNERNRAMFEQEKEKEIYHAKIEFFTNVAHEIRTPLTLIKGPLETVVDEVGEMPRIKKSLKSIERNTERLLMLTNQLLDFRKTENKGFSLSFVKANVPKILKDNCLTFLSVAEQKRLVFEVELPEKKFYAFIDIEAFHKILSNLIDNAIKYADGKVSICLLPVNLADGVFIIEVRNDGFLIPWSLREKIFEPFFRVENTEKQSGSGIGLSLARSLTELHRGVLELRKVENHMNVFVLTLPIHQEVEFNFGATQKKKLNE